MDRVSDERVNFPNASYLFTAPTGSELSGAHLVLRFEAVGHRGEKSAVYTGPRALLALKFDAEITVVERSHLTEESRNEFRIRNVLPPLQAKL